MTDAIRTWYIKLKCILCQNKHSQRLSSILLLWKSDTEAVFRDWCNTILIVSSSAGIRCPSCLIVHAVMKEVMHSCRNRWMDRQYKASFPQLFMFWTNAVYFLFLLPFPVKCSYCGEHRRASSEHYHCSANKQSQHIWLISLFVVAVVNRTLFLLFPAPHHPTSVLPVQQRWRCRSDATV